MRRKFVSRFEEWLRLSLILRSREGGVSKDEANIGGLMVRDGAMRLLTMRV